MKSHTMIASKYNLGTLRQNVSVFPISVIDNCIEEGHRANTWMFTLRKLDDINLFINLNPLLNDQPLTVYGDGTQTRSFCYVDDLVDGITRLLYSKIAGPVNMGNPKEFTILEFAQLIRRKYDPKAKIIYQPLPQDDPKQRRPDISLARKELGWKPKVDLEEGISRTMNWFARNYHGH